MGEHMKNRKSGVTIIALVVTVIVLLILAGVSIATLSGDNGIINRTGKTKDDSIIADEKEKMTLAWNSLVKRNALEDIEITDRLLEDEIKKYDSNITVDYDDYNNFWVSFNNTKNYYLINKNNSNISKLESEPVIITDTIYVTLYNDGTLAFSNDNETDTSKTVTRTYTVSKNDLYDSGDRVPWKNERNSINQVIFVNRIRPTSTAFWFYDCINLETIDQISNLKTNQTTSFAAMFRDCKSLLNLDVSTFNTSNVTDMSALFMGCVKLTTLNLSNFDTKKVSLMNNMFSGWRDDLNGFDKMGLTSLNVSSFDTSNVTNMRGMFFYCYNLTSLDVTSFNTSNVTNMTSMFMNCAKLTTLDVSSFDTRKVTETHDMFGAWDYINNTDLTLAIQTIYVGDLWSMSLVTDSQNMFKGCSSLVGGKGTTYNSSKIDKTYARVDGGPSSSTPGYLTYKSN